MSSQSRFYKWTPPTRRITLGEFPNQFFDSNVSAMNQPELTDNPAEVDFQYSTTVPRNPQAVDNTIESFPVPGLTTRDYLRRDYRFSPLRTVRQPTNHGNVPFYPMRRNKAMAAGELNELPAGPMGPVPSN